MSISGSGGWGASESLGGPNRSNERSGGENNSGASISRDRLSKQQFESLFGGGGSNNAPNRSGNGGSDRGSSAPSRDLGSLRADLDRRDRAAVAALGGLTGGVNQASAAFNDDEEGINSIGEALDRFGAWAKDQVGINNPRGFLGSNVAKIGAGALGFLAGGAPGAALASTAVSVASDPKPSRNMIGYAASALGGMPGLGGLAATGVSLLDDNIVDLDKVNPSQLGGVAGATASAAASTPGLTSFPSGSQGGDNPVLRQAANTALAASRTGGNQTTKPKPNPNTIRRTFSPLNISYARLRGIEELL